jgi:transcriptional regulator with XRE-family HTH domain
MITYGMSDMAILREMGLRLRKTRLRQNLTQEKVADLAGVTRTTISEMERGKPFEVVTLVQVLRALRSLESIDAFLPDPGISPLQLARMRGKERQRASS